MRPRVLAEAEAEILSAMLYYEDRQEGLGLDFCVRVSDAMAAIGRNPQRYPVYEGKQSSRTFRRAPVERFPFIVVYQVRADETLVVAIAHSSRNPGYWESRNPVQES
ncbi:type II toxin-antitoxin system RelE/ParE family toxin [Pirellulales bacterium]|nr:type II toxin-antitoxin system RelE/ParE family toxin [Pirellulales bacterium]